MSAHARFISAADAIADYRDALYSGRGPKLYCCGADALASFPIGPGRVVLLGGLPGGGKTALTCQLAIDALRAEPDLRCLIANVEMTPAVLLDRQIARLSGVTLDVITSRQLDRSHAGRIDAALETLESVADRLAFLSAPFDLGNAAAAADAHGAELLVLDYLQRMRPPGTHGDKRGAVDELMDYLRQFADAGCAVLAVSAVARSKDRRGRSTYDGESLSLASFRESSELEYGADAAYVLVPEPDESESVTLRCLKNRHGEPRDIPLRFERQYQRFTPLADAPDTRAAGGPGRDRLSAKLAELWNRTPAADDASGDDE